MMKPNRISIVAVTALLLAGVVGCEQLPGTSGQQGAVIGGAGGAAAGAVVAGSGHRWLGALLGGAIGAGGGYLIGANVNKITGKDTEGAQKANQQAQQNPVTPEQARTATTADINGDGFVTMDEIVAMKQAGLSDQQMIQRMQATGQVFELTQQQQQYLLSHGVDQSVVNQIPEINRAAKQTLENQNPNVGSQPATTTP